MFSFRYVFGLAAAVLLVAVCPAASAWAQLDSQDASLVPVAITLQVPQAPTGVVTTVTVELVPAASDRPTHVRVASDASPALPVVVGARVGGDVLESAQVDARGPFTWQTQTPAQSGCGPHPAPGTAHCPTATAAAVTTPAMGGASLQPQPTAVPRATEVPSPAASSTNAPAPATAVSETQAPAAAPQVAGAQARGSGPPSRAGTTAPSAQPGVTDPVLYTVQPGDSLARIARQFYGETAAVSRIVEANVGRAMPDGATFTTPNVIRPGWVLTLPLPMRAIEDRDGARWYSVQAGDSLAMVAARLLGTQSRWPELFELNRDVVGQPSLIRAGDQLKLSTTARADDGPPPSRAESSTIPQASDSRTSEAVVMASATLVTATEPELLPAAADPMSVPMTAAAPEYSMSAQLLAHEDSPPVSAPPMLLLGGLAAVALGQRRSWPGTVAGRAPRRGVRDGSQSAAEAHPDEHQQRIRLSPREQRRTQVLQALLAGALSRTEAAQALDLSLRQLRRLVLAYRKAGPQALVHANRGRTPWQAVPREVRAEVVRLARGRYAGFSQQQLAERLATEHGIVLHRTTIRRILLEARQGSASSRAPAALGPRREPPGRHQCLGRGTVPGCHCV